MNQSPGQQGSSITGPYLDGATSQAAHQLLSPAVAQSLPRDPIGRGPEDNGEQKKATGQKKLMQGC